MSLNASVVCDQRAQSIDARKASHWMRAGILAFGLALASCGSTGTTPSGQIAAPPGQVATPAAPVILGRDGITPPFMAGRSIVRIGLLLPFASRPAEAGALYQAAELAVFTYGDQTTLLIPRDSGSSAAEAAANTRLLLRDGADVILGPIERDTVAGAAGAARERNVPVIGFSSDRTIAGNGVYILSLPLEEDVRRVVDYAVSKGLRSYALLAPENDYGRRVEAALRAEAEARGGVVGLTQFYQRGDREAAAAARTLATQLKRTPVQAILIAESGSVLRATGPALLIGGVNMGQVKLLGTGAWAGGDAQREPTLAGGWYASPDPALRADFEQRFRAAYNRPPSRIASLGYDAVMLAVQAAQAGRQDAISRASLERPIGFAGADGLFRFRQDGSIERGLAILELRQQGPTAIDPAPRTLRVN
ncbi:MAG: penicillin-binding protein activator [Hyphomonadaceae bacterium]|nr:MAG: branched-chain amino acid ABC transporter periplasmic protein [Caulobacteraceae bacterium]MBT9444470.1 penicillin-binding protein activator [Hyphomonadaceae bacterium]TPW07114.1 MAG: branched-chain amino acid ABC transporter periplasmic protein [Alphaproteobacteria bacterium]